MTEPPGPRTPTLRFPQPNSDDPSARTANVAALVEGPLPTAIKFRMLLVSFLAAAIGAMAGVIAYLLYNLIGAILAGRALRRLEEEHVREPGWIRRFARK